MTNTYNTASLPLAAYLLYAGAQLVDLRPETTDSRKFRFYFEGDRLPLVEYTDRFHKGEALVEPYSYAAALGNLHSQVRDRRAFNN